MTTTHSRRNLLRTGALASAAALGATSIRGFTESAVAAVPTASSRAALATSTGCTTLTKELTEGPFWIDERLHRSDVRPDSDTGAIEPGVPLTLSIRLQDAGAGCSAQIGAYVDIWHANAQGTYSDVSGAGNPDNRGLDWLRGYQISDDDGTVTFTTIMPGYYTGRTIHIHFRVRLTLADDTEVDFTSQLYFDESVNEAVLATAAYRQSEVRDQTNSSDGLYDAALLVPVTGSVSTGYVGTFTVNLDFGDSVDDTTTTTTTPSTPGDLSVDARIVRAAVRRGKRRRIVRVVIRNHEKVTAKVRLVRGDTVLATKTWGWLPKGRRVLKVRIPDSVPAGRARVMVTFADAAGNSLVDRKRVRVVSV